MIDSLFNVESSAELADCIKQSELKGTFVDIRSAIRGELKPSKFKIQKIIDLCVASSCQDQAPRSGLYLEIAVMVNALLENRNDSAFNLDKILHLLKGFNNDESICFAKGLAYYSRGEYALAEESFKCYGRFSNEKPLYHRTASAAFRGYVPSLHIDKLPPKTCGEFHLVTKAKCVDNVTVLVSCDIGYFKAYQEDFLSAIGSVNKNIAVHFHIICRAQENFEKALYDFDYQRIDNIGISLECLSYGNIRTYTSLSRYAIAEKIMKFYKSAIFVSDIDLVVKENPQKLLNENPEKIGLYFGNYKNSYFPWHAIKAGAGIYPYSQSSIDFLETIGRFMMYSYRSGNDGWMLDQLSIEYAYRNAEDDSIFYDLKETDFPLTQFHDRGERRAVAKKYTDINSSNKILHYEKDKEIIHDRIKELGFSDFKIALKTKDESFLVKSWLDHYGDIFGYENILVFDNESSDEEVLNVYRKYNGSLGCLFQYGDQFGDHNSIHYPDRYPDLYEEISKKCKYFALFDSDEFLVHIDKNKVTKGRALKNILDREAMKSGYADIIFGFWLNSVPGREDVFQIGSNYTKLYNGVKNGKHFIPASYLKKFRRGHNSCAPTDLVGDKVSNNFWILHRQSSSVDRRIRVNFNKIKARNAFKEGVVYDDILCTPSFDMLVESKKSRTVLAYMTQIIRMINEGGSNELLNSSEKMIKEGVANVADNAIDFSNIKSEKLFKSFVSNDYYRLLVSSYLSHKYTCRLNKVPMLDLGVYGEVLEFSAFKIKGWFLDTLSISAPIIQIRINNKVFDEISPDEDSYLPFLNEVEMLGFSYKIDKDKVLDFLGEGYASSEIVMTVVSERVNKKLRKATKVFKLGVDFY